MTHAPGRRRGLSRHLVVALALALPLGTASLATTSANASDDGRTAAMSSSDVNALVREADAAEREAVAAVDAVPVARDRIAPALKKAQNARTRVQQREKPVKKLTNRVQKRQQRVKQQRQRVKNRQRAVKRAKAPAKRVARVKLRQARKNLQQRRVNLRKTRTNLQKRRATLRQTRNVSQKAWDTWRDARDKHQAALAYVEVAAQTAERKREVADRGVASITTVTGAKVTVLPRIDQASARTAAADQAKHVVNVRSTPALPYFPVTLQRQQGSSWTNVTTTETQAGGRVDVTVDQGGTYRAVVDDFTTDPAGDDFVVTFDDEFTGGTLRKDWVHRMGMHREESMRKCARGDERAVSMTGQTVRLWVKKDPDKNTKCLAPYQGNLTGPWSYRINGHIGTQGTYSFQYGVAAARIKFQTAAEGQHAAFWLQPASHSGEGTGPTHQGAEIDVVEFTGLKPTGRPGLGRGVWYPTGKGDEEVHVGGLLTQEEAEAFRADKDDKWHNRYHVFSVEWTPNEYVYRIDGKEFFRTDVGISHRPQYPILSLLSSDYALARAGAEGEKQLGSQHIDVDWVRVWQ